MSRRKRKTIKATVRKVTRGVGRERPNKLAMWGSTRFTDYESFITSGLPFVEAQQES